jgi:hypothetical protein
MADYNVSREPEAAKDAARNHGHGGRQERGRLLGHADAVIE